MEKKLIALKKYSLLCLLLISIGIKAQQNTDGSRTCGPEFAPLNLQGLTLKQLLEHAGGRHNDYLDFIYEKISMDLSILNSKDLQTFLQRNTQSFFAALGITPANNPLIAPFDVSNYDFEPVGLSLKATAIIIELKTIRANYEVANHQQSIFSLNELRERAMNLEDFTEAVKVGVPVSIAIFSYAYWYENIGKWEDMFTRCGNDRAPCKADLKKLAGSDIAGGVVGATGGGIGAGVVGAVAGGLLGGGVSSAYNILKQGLICSGGVVGRVLSWLSDWF